MTLEPNFKQKEPVWEEEFAFDLIPNLPLEFKIETEDIICTNFTSDYCVG